VSTKPVVEWSVHCLAVKLYVCGPVVDHLTMLTRHLEKQLQESRSEAEKLRHRVELLSEESQRVARDKAAVLHTLSRKVCHS